MDNVLQYNLLMDMKKKMYYQHYYGIELLYYVKGIFLINLFF